MTRTIFCSAVLPGVGCPWPSGDVHSRSHFPWFLVVEAFGLFFCSSGLQAEGFSWQQEWHVCNSACRGAGFASTRHRLGLHQEAAWLSCNSFVSCVGKRQNITVLFRSLAIARRMTWDPRRMFGRRDEKREPSDEKRTHECACIMHEKTMNQQNSHEFLFFLNSVFAF